MTDRLRRIRCHADTPAATRAFASSAAPGKRPGMQAGRRHQLAFLCHPIYLSDVSGRYIGWIRNLATVAPIVAQIGSQLPGARALPRATVAAWQLYGKEARADMSQRSGVLELAVLGLLHETPMHGYELRKRLNSVLGAF